MEKVAVISNAQEDAERLPAREDFVRALNWVLDERGMSQRDLAEGMGWGSHTRIQPWIRGRAEPKPSEVFALERFLRVPPGTLSIHLGYLPPETRVAVKMSFDDLLRGDPNLGEQGRRILAAVYAEVTRKTPKQSR